MALIQVTDVKGEEKGGPEQKKGCKKLQEQGIMWYEWLLRQCDMGALAAGSALQQPLDNPSSDNINTSSVSFKNAVPAMGAPNFYLLGVAKSYHEALVVSTHETLNL